ncbi:MAG: NAD(P)-dependent oxidoreductase [Eubacteriales bacterium]|nr:NAD(P)-dependent oxidoreductase [Eubacteriales bacterium]
MRIFLAGQGAREAYVAQLARERGHQIAKTADCDVAVLTLPRSHLPMGTEHWPAGQKIVCGLTDPSLEAMAEKKGWTLWRVLADEDYICRNAALSAEGAVYAAMHAADFALGQAHCLVIGYGRIGQALTAMLRGLGARVTVAARRRESREAAGEGSIDLPQLHEALPEMDVVFNTVPALVLGRELLARVKPHALLIELASAPYGIDGPAAREMGLRAWTEGGVPGRYCPQSAAALLLDYVERRWAHE